MGTRKWRSEWAPTCRIERYKNSEVPRAVLDEIANTVYTHKNGGSSAQECEAMREIKENISDCTRGDMIYIVIRHDKKIQNNGCERESARNGSQRGGRSNGSGVTAQPNSTECDNSTRMNNVSGTRVRKRHLRRPTTSALSDKVWREMRKQVTGRAQDDGVT